MRRSLPVGKRGIEDPGEQITVNAHMLCDQQVFHDRHLAEQTNVLEGACQPGAVNQMRPAKHLIEKALPQLCRVNPVVRLEFLPVPE